MAPSHVRVAVRLHVKQLTGENAGQPLSSEITHPGCRPSDPKGKATLGRALCSESSAGPAESTTLCTRGHSMLENREISTASEA